MPPHAGILTGQVRVTIITVMAKRQPFSLIYDLEVRGHLAAIESKYRSLIRTTIEEQLRYEPETATRNRKQLERPIDQGARWELRLGPDNRFRVFYRVDAEERQVRILAIAVKERNQVFIAGAEVEL
jgi:plasmid stabilization system protein ParE